MKAMYRILKVTHPGSEPRFYPQVKGFLGWNNVHFDYYLPSESSAKKFLDDYTMPPAVSEEVISYENPYAVRKTCWWSVFFRIFLGD